MLGKTIISIQPEKGNKTSNPMTLNGIIRSHRKQMPSANAFISKRIASNSNKWELQMVGATGDIA